MQKFQLRHSEVLPEDAVATNPPWPCSQFINKNFNVSVLQWEECSLNAEICRLLVPSAIKKY